MMIRTSTRRAVAGAVLALAAASPLPALAAAQTRAEGQWLFLLPVAWNEADEAFDEDGDKIPRDRFEMLEVSPFLEYGASDVLTLGVQPKYRRVTVDGDQGEVTNEGLAEVDVWARRKLWQSGDAVLSLQGLVKAPAEPDEEHEAALGRDQVDTELSMQFGNRHGLDGGGSIFYNAELGYRWRFEGLDDQVQANAYLGWGLANGLAFILRSANTFGDADDNGGVDEVLTGGPSFRRHDAQLIASYRLTDTVSLVGGYSTTYAGEDIGAGDTVFVSLLHRSN